MISVLLPTRKRPLFLKRMVDSLREMSTIQPEIIVYIDDDDQETPPMAAQLGLVSIIGPRITMTDYWNKCYEKASNDIVMQAGDDIVFRTKGWDKMVEDEFAKWPDKIVLVHGDDLDDNFRSNFGTHSLLHRRWIETLGYFIPPYFSSDNGDRWLMAVANFLGRRVYLPFVTEHLHYRTGKAVLDDTYKERLARHRVDNPDQLYMDMISERIQDAAKLQAIMDEELENVNIA
jgi:glycosyltransferase involved in cell wall biosynthesis